MAYKNDTEAKQAFIEEILTPKGFDAHVKAEPADIVATKDGETWYYEIKMTEKDDKCFGAATLTEWVQALKTPNNFRFVLAIKGQDGKYNFKEYTPEEFMEFSTIPPFKVYFNINLRGSTKQKRRKSNGAIPFTKERCFLLQELFHRMKEDKLRFGCPTKSFFHPFLDNMTKI